MNRAALTVGTALLVLAAASSAGAQCRTSGDGVVVEDGRLRVTGAIRFDLYGPTLDPASLPVIDAVARRLRACPDLRLEIQVHTDTRRTGAFNARSSAAIAGLIRDRLVAQGVPGERLVACGYGESRPVTEAGREPWDPRNNRVEWVRIADPAAHHCPPADG